MSIISTRKEVQEMNIKIKKGCYQYPDDWVLIQNMDPMKADYCLALQIKNGEDLGLPTFLFLLKENTGLTSNFIKNLYVIIAKDYPQLKSSIDVDTILDQLGIDSALDYREEILESHPIGVFDPMVLRPDLVAFEISKSEQ